jgi:hypothetical protein
MQRILYIYKTKQEYKDAKKLIKAEVDKHKKATLMNQRGAYIYKLNCL